VNSHFRSWSHNGLPNFQRAIAGVKTHWNWRVFYIIENLLKCKCLKWAHMTHLDIWNTTSSQRKSRKSNWQFDSWPLKVGNRPDFLTFRWCVTYRWKSLDEGYNFSSNLIAIKGLHTKLWGIKITRVPTLGILWSPIWESRDKMPFGCGPCGETQFIL
jgi:hypothetical protein